MKGLRVTILFLVVSLLGMLAADNIHAQSRGGVELALKEVPANVKSGSSFNARLLVKIDEGWHIYGLNKIENGPIPTKIDLAATQPFTLAGEIETPVPIVDRDSAFNVDVEYYEGEAEFKLPIKVATKVQGQKHNLIISVRYQMCNKEVCRRPNVIEIKSAVNVMSSTHSKKPSSR